ncbi:monovalent cation/H(+) antiporter subunit G [Myxococcus sp. RHSTA-1-4]|uniref:monovalent cation/H(+) antiporter subunit G n=1 Tax=Myxococcus sp. RHSTA-1-4 TaxID=2874601 RepID=UPI001CBF8F6B|nr:monovalent cation/H(+) antiporter subunit G [Myxococcus sp. RHSTA-1-4]MBZ4420001.1 monovalent cation/H(+) antiporter subunit G [Myxococcus sp. RHSTA-1-4]
MLRGFAVCWMVAGAAFMAIAALGIVRMPDLFTRMQAATKTGTAGAGCILLGTALFFAEAQVAAKAALVIAFLFLTAPVAAHMLARAGYLVGIPLAPQTHPDELKDRFGRGTTVPGGTPSAKGEPPAEER